MLSDCVILRNDPYMMSLQKVRKRLCKTEHQNAKFCFYSTFNHQLSTSLVQNDFLHQTPSGRFFSSSPKTLTALTASRRDNQSRGTPPTAPRRSFHPESLFLPDAETAAFQFGNEQLFLLDGSQANDEEAYIRGYCKKSKSVSAGRNDKMQNYVFVQLSTINFQRAWCKMTFCTKLISIR